MRHTDPQTEADPFRDADFIRNPFRQYHYTAFVSAVCASDGVQRGDAADAARILHRLYDRGFHGDFYQQHQQVRRRRQDWNSARNFYGMQFPGGPDELRNEICRRKILPYYKPD